MPSLGSLISQQYIKRIIKCNFKCFLIKSLFCVFCHYILYILGIFYEEIILLLIARFLLGLSSLDRLCKIYIDQCIPSSEQAKCNKNYLTLIYIGYISGLIASDIEIIIFSSSEGKEYEYLYIISCILFSIVSLVTIFLFKNPNSEKFKILKNSIIEYNKENRLTTKFLDEDEKEIVEKQDNLFQNANNLTHLSGENALTIYSDEIKKKKSSYFTKVFLLLLLFLLSAQYTNENNLMFIPKQINPLNQSNSNHSYKSIYFS